MRVRHFTFLIILLLFTGCSTLRTNIVDPTGRAMPSPHYVLRVTGTPLTATFYYTAYRTITDVDGSSVAQPEYLDFLKFHDLYAEKYKAVTLTIEVNNPSHIEYSLYQSLDMEIGKGRKQVRTGGEIKRSNLEYRQFVYPLPFGEDIRTVNQYVSMSINNAEVVRIGNFRYNLIH